MKDDIEVVKAIYNSVNEYYQHKGGYDEDQSLSKEFMINLTYRHEKISLDGGCLLWNRSSEKRGEIVSKGCIFKAGNDIFKQEPPRD